MCVHEAWENHLVLGVDDELGAPGDLDSLPDFDDLAFLYVHVRTGVNLLPVVHGGYETILD